MEPAQAFGLALRRRRRAVSFTQERLAADADMERVMISLLETGRNLPTLHTTMKLAQALGCKASDLVLEMETLLASAS